MTPPPEVQIRVNSEVYTLNHTNTWLYSYTVEPHHNFVLHETEDAWVRIFNNMELYEKLFSLEHNCVTEWEPNETIRAAYESTMQTSFDQMLTGLQEMLNANEQ